MTAELFSSSASFLQIPLPWVTSHTLEHPLITTHLDISRWEYSSATVCFHPIVTDTVVNRADQFKGRVLSSRKAPKGPIAEKVHPN